MVNLIFIMVLSAQITPETPDPTAFDAFFKQSECKEARSYKLKESLAATLKEKSEIYLTSTFNCISDYYKQMKTYNAVPETTQHNYKKDFKFLE